MKLSVQKIQILFAVSLIFFSCIQVRAEPQNPKEQLNQSLIFAAPPPPKDIGEPVSEQKQVAVAVVRT